MLDPSPLVSPGLPHRSSRSEVKTIGLPTVPFAVRVPSITIVEAAVSCILITTPASIVSVAGFWMSSVPFMR